MNVRDGMDGRTHARTFDCVFSSTSREQRDLVGKRPLTLPPTPEAENNGKKIKSAFPYEAPLIIVEGHTRLFVAVVVVSLRFIQQRKPFYSPLFLAFSFSSSFLFQAGSRSASDSALLWKTHNH